MKQTLAIICITLFIGGVAAISFISYHEYNKPENIKARKLKREQLEKEKQDKQIQQEKIAKELEQERIREQQDQERIVKEQQEQEAKKRVEEE